MTLKRNKNVGTCSLMRSMMCVCVYEKEEEKIDVMDIESHYKIPLLAFCLLLLCLFITFFRLKIVLGRLLEGCDGNPGENVTY